jgi:DNA-binding NtrC family response regulator
MSSVLVIDDEAGMRRTLEMVLEKAGFEVVSCGTVEEIQRLFGHNLPDVVITDLRMEPVSGLDVLRTVKQRSPGTEVILMTAFGTIDTAVEAMRLGAFDYITKPFHSAELIAKVRKALEKKTLVTEVQDLRREVQSSYGIDSTIAESPAMHAVLAQIRQIAPTPLTVLITGETGTGKGLIARLIHHNGPDAKARFISVNVSAIPEPLLESELFGHEKGAFTGAIHSRKGLFEEAHCATLFLDEIGSFPANLQSKLLGVLQDRELRRVGSNRVIPIDVRIIAATNSNLEQAVARGQFRQDLYYRLNVARIHLPPLRERREDIEPCARHFIAELSRRRGRHYELSEDTVGMLLDHDYPGNVRELQNAIEWAAAMCPEGLIKPPHLPESIRSGPRHAAEAPGPVGTLDQHEKEMIANSIVQHHGNLTEVARALGIGRTTLWRKMREYGIRK